MSPDEPSLSDHEQRILAEIERNLAQEDPDFVRNVSEVRPGLCPECGVRLADHPGHQHQTIDPRWAALRDLVPGGPDAAEAAPTKES